MKTIVIAAFLLSFATLSHSQVLVDRIFESEKIAEGIPATITYKIYNNYNV